MVYLGYSLSQCSLCRRLGFAPLNTGIKKKKDASPQAPLPRNDTIFLSTSLNFYLNPLEYFCIDHTGRAMTTTRLL